MRVEPHQIKPTCGTHLGETKLVASITDSPDSDSMSIKLILVSAGTMVWGGEEKKKRGEHLNISKYFNRQR